jgi:hypothetical protein
MVSGGVLWTAVVIVLGVPRGAPAQQPQPGKVVPKPEQLPPGKVMPKLEPIAETRLLMEGLAHANFRGLERLLTSKPPDVQTWTFARGQALLIAETANLLMLRPPKGQGQAPWFDRAMDLRNASKQLAATIATQDYDKSRAGLITLATVCNRCHQTFRVSVDIAVFQEKSEPK